MTHTPNTPTPASPTGAVLKAFALGALICAVGGVLIGAVAGLTDGGSVENMFIGGIYAGVIGLFMPGLLVGAVLAGIAWKRHH